MLDLLNISTERPANYNGKLASITKYRRNNVSPTFVMIRSPLLTDSVALVTNLPAVKIPFKVDPTKINPINNFDEPMSIHSSLQVE